ncbi:hypothetical protein RBB77_17750 [Tunturibacter psychrotolerans]|uniref:Roadblock/LC7 domain-containing protein n=1 Tax=Tunturiibacter psychrotolerans TaxID=3069686 RepID=A0AAU7ZN82_9BACT
MSAVAPFTSAIDLCTVIEEDGGTLLVALERRTHQGRAASRVSNLSICAMFQQQLSDVGALVVGRKNERGISTLVLLVYVDLLVDQSLGDLDFVAPRRVIEILRLPMQERGQRNHDEEDGN